jgi:uncharacterized protein (DUF2249 family)
MNHHSFGYTRILLSFLFIFIATTVEAQNLMLARGFTNTAPLGGGVNLSSIGVDAAGNRYVSGSFSGAADFDPGPGTQTVISAGSTDIYIAKYDASGNYLWIKRIGSTASETINAMSVDAAGNVYLTGNFSGTVDFNPGPGTQNLIAVGNGDIFFAKYDASGNYAWAKSIGGTNLDAGTAITLDGAGNIYVAGQFSATVDFDPGAGTQNLSSSGNGDIFLAKYNAAGDYLLAIKMGGTNSESPEEITVDASGNSYIAGFFNGTVDFDPGAGILNLVSAGGSDVFIAKYDPAGAYVWARKIGGTASESLGGMGIDISGNMYITGMFGGTVDFDPGVSTQNLISTGSSDIYLAKYNPGGDYIWANRIGGTSGENANAMIVEPTGDCYMTGNFALTVDFDPGAGTQNLTSVGTSADIFLAKYNTSGTYVYARATGGAGVDVGHAVALDAGANIHIGGVFHSTADFDPGAGIANLFAGTTTSAFLLNLTAAGDYVSAILMGGYNNPVLPDHGRAVKTDASGNIYSTGTFSGTVDFDPGAGIQYLTAVGNPDIFLVKYDVFGNYVWAKSIGGAAVKNALALVLDAAGNVYIAGSFTGTVDFNPGAAVQNLVSSGSTDIFIAKYDASGNYVWAFRVGGTGNDQAQGLAIDATNNIYVTGSYSNTADFDPGAGIQNLTSAGTADIFLAKYNASGSYLWARGIGAGNGDVAYGVAVDASGNPHITGSFSVTVDFDPGAGTQSLASAGSTDTFLAKYDASGNYVWAIRIGGTGIEMGTAIAIDGTDNCYITGQFFGVTDFDPSAGTQNLTALNLDGFLGKYDASGNYVWAIRIGGSTVDIGNGLALDDTDNVYITGNFSGTADFDPGAGTQNLVTSSSFDIFLAKYSPTGAYVWANAMGVSVADDLGYAVTIDASNNCVLTGSFQGNADFNPGAGIYALQSVNSNDFFIAKYGPTITLPVRLESFTCQLVDNGTAVSLQWTTTTQENHAFFEVERSTANGSPAKLGRVNGCGTCNDRQEYSFRDNQPLTGHAYYRLRIVDNNGREEYSKWISIYKKEKGGSLLLYPAVTTGNVEMSCSITGATRTMYITIIDAAGKVVQQRRQVFTNGNNQLQLDLSSQASGLYYVQVAEQEGRVVVSGSVIRQ